MELPNGERSLGLQETQHYTSEQPQSLCSGGGGRGRSLDLPGPVVEPQQVLLRSGVAQDLVHRVWVRRGHPLEPAEELQGGRVLERLLQQGPQGPPGEQQGRVARQTAVDDSRFLAVA